ncbi:MAG: hypothetical protein M5U26_25325 [Planctomycetota bacterium]|nr:hypothetical protein [Planctomycetota bacterium]
MPRSVLSESHLATFDFNRAVSMNMPSSQAMDEALADLREVQGDALLIGGLAVGYYGHERGTKDIDILYSNLDGEILKRLSKHFKVVRNAPNGWHHLEHKKNGVRLELIPEGGLTTYGFIPSPYTVGGRDGFISLWGLVWLKMVSGRSQDMADLVNLAKKHLDSMLALRDRLPSELHERFDEVCRQAKLELGSDPNTRDDIGAPDPGYVQDVAAKYGKRRKEDGAAPKRPAE